MQEVWSSQKLWLNRYRPLNKYYFYPVFHVLSFVYVSSLVNEAIFGYTFLYKI